MYHPRSKVLSSHHLRRAKVRRPPPHVPAPLPPPHPRPTATALTTTTLYHQRACTPHHTGLTVVCVLHVVSMMMVMMNAASSGALMGLALTTHASTPAPTTRLSTIQMAKVDRTFERWKRSMTRQGNDGGYGQSQQGMPQEGYGPMGDQQGMQQQQGMPQQGYGPMTPRQRIQQQQAMRQQGMQGMQGMPGMQP